MNNMNKIAIIGAGLQAGRRLPAILADKNAAVKWIIDRNVEKAEKMATRCGAKWDTDWTKAAKDNDVNIILVLTYPDTHAQISIGSMKNGKDVLCEKPLARTEQEAGGMIRTAKKYKKILKCGFNHRHHPAILDAYKIFTSENFGRPLFGRSIYGIAGREGLEKEWRSDPRVVSGGQFMEQGIHVVDLFRLFLGDIAAVSGMVEANYWPIKPFEDNGFAMLRSKSGAIAAIHSSLTQWINTFEFEIYGENAYFKISGLGGAYGNEKLIYGLRETNKPFSYHITEYRGADISWEKEWKEFTDAVKFRRQPLGNADDGLKAMKIVNAVYKSSKTGAQIDLVL